MVFTTPAFANSKQWLRYGWLGLMLLFAQPVAAASFHISNVDLHLHEGVYLLDADIYYGFSDEALDALHNGVPLTIMIDIQIERPRRWLWNVGMASLQQELRLHYHALSEQYVVQNLNSGALHSYHSRGVALSALGRLRDFPLIDKQLLAPEEEFLLRMQARLNIEALPQPLRPIAYTTPAWRQLKSDWYQWPFTP